MADLVKFQDQRYSPDGRIRCFSLAFFPALIKSRGFLMKGKVIASFAGTGKTFLANHYTNVVDLDLGSYKFFDDIGDSIPFEERKAIKKYDISPEWPQNYLDAIMENIPKYDIVLVSYCTEVEEFLHEQGIDLYYFVPESSGWEVLEKRFRERGNPERFIGICKMLFDAQAGLQSDKIKKTYLGDNDYLECALLRNGFLDEVQKRGN